MAKVQRSGILRSWASSSSELYLKGSGQVPFVRGFVADNGALLEPADKGTLLQAQALAAQSPLQEVLHAEGTLDERVYL